MECEKACSLQSSITKGFLILSTMIQQTWQKIFAFSRHLETLQIQLRTSHQLSAKCSHDCGNGRWLVAVNGCHLKHVHWFNLPNKYQSCSRFFEGIREACSPPALRLSPASFRGRVTSPFNRVKYACRLPLHTKEGNINFFKVNTSVSRQNSGVLE